MDSISIGIIGLYLIFVGFQGNAKELFLLLESELKPYAAAVIVVVILYEAGTYSGLRPTVVGFSLIIIATLLLSTYTQPNGKTATQNISEFLHSL